MLLVVIIEWRNMALCRSTSCALQECSAIFYFPEPLADPNHAARAVVGDPCAGERPSRRAPRPQPSGAAGGLSAKPGVSPSRAERGTVGRHLGIPVENNRVVLFADQDLGARLRARVG